MDTSAEASSKPTRRRCAHPLLEVHARTPRDRGAWRPDRLRRGAGEPPRVPGGLSRRSGAAGVSWKGPLLRSRSSPLALLAVGTPWASRPVDGQRDASPHRADQGASCRHRRRRARRRPLLRRVRPRARRRRPQHPWERTRHSPSASASRRRAAPGVAENLSEALVASVASRTGSPGVTLCELGESQRRGKWVRDIFMCIFAMMRDLRGRAWPAPGTVGRRAERA